MARAYDSDVLVDEAGNVLVNALGTLYTDAAHTTLVTDNYTAETGGTLSNTVTTDASGRWAVHFTTRKSYWVRWSDNSNTAYAANRPTVPLTWTTFTSAEHQAFEKASDETSDDARLTAVEGGLAQEVADRVSGDALAVHLVGTETITGIKQGLGVTTDRIIHVSKGSRGSDSNDGVSLASPLATVGAALTAAAALGGAHIKLGYGDWTEQVAVASDNIFIEGLGSLLSRITYNGSGVAFDANVVGGATIRRGLRCKGFTIYISGGGSGVIGARLDNVYESVWDDVPINGLSATNSTALQLIGGTSKSCYYNDFYECNLTASGKVADIGNGCNANQWFGGVWDGAGVAVTCNPTINDSSNNVGENKWFGTSMNTSNASFMSLGTGTGQVTNFEFHGCRMEPSASTLTTGANSSGVCFFGGTKANITVANTGTNNRFMWANSFDPGGFTATGSIGATGFVTGQGGVVSGADAASGSVASINAAAATQRALAFRTAGVNRWSVLADAGAEAGSNAGSDLQIVGYTDAGSGTTYATIRRSDGRLTFGEAVNFQFGGTTGTKFGTSTSDKMAWWNATPVVQPAGSTDVLASLVTLGLRAASSNPPLNLGTGTLTAGKTTVTADAPFVTGSNISGGSNTLAIGTEGATSFRLFTQGTLRLIVGATGAWTLTDATTIDTGSSTGLKMPALVTNKWAAWGATPIVQPTTGVAAATLTGGGGTTLTDTDTFDGYTLKQVVKALRLEGLLA